MIIKRSSYEAKYDAVKFSNYSYNIGIYTSKK